MWGSRIYIGLRGARVSQAAFSRWFLSRGITKKSLLLLWVIRVHLRSQVATLGDFASFLTALNYS